MTQTWVKNKFFKVSQCPEQILNTNSVEPVNETMNSQ
jgi:hypothetical protein